MISLTAIVGILVATVALIVGGACLSVSLITSLDTINTVGEAWARGMGDAVLKLTTSTFNKHEAHLLAAGPVMRRDANMIPEDLAALQGKNWTDTWFPYLQAMGVKLKLDNN